MTTVKLTEQQRTILDFIESTENAELHCYINPRGTQMYRLRDSARASPKRNIKTSMVNNLYDKGKLRLENGRYYPVKQND